MRITEPNERIQQKSMAGDIASTESSPPPGGNRTAVRHHHPRAATKTRKTSGKEANAEDEDRHTAPGSAL